MAEPRANGRDREPDGPWTRRVVDEHDPRFHDGGWGPHIDALRRAIEEQGEYLRQTLRQEGERNRDRMQRDAAYVGSKIAVAGHRMGPVRQAQPSSVARELADDRALLGRMIEDMGKNLGRGASRATQRFRDRPYASSETTYSNGLLAQRRFQGVRWASPDRDALKDLKAEYQADQKAMRQAWKHERQTLSMWEKYGPGSGRHKEAFERDWQRQRIESDRQRVYDKYGAKGNGVTPTGHDHDGQGR